MARKQPKPIRVPTGKRSAAKSRPRETVIVDELHAHSSREILAAFASCLPPLNREVLEDFTRILSALNLIPQSNREDRVMIAAAVLLTSELRKIDSSLTLTTAVADINPW